MQVDERKQDWLQYSSQIVETDTVSLEFSGKILRFTLHTVFLTEMPLLPPQCWATRILKHWDHCDTQINIGEGETDASVSRFLTSIVVQRFGLRRLQRLDVIQGEPPFPLLTQEDKRRLCSQDAPRGCYFKLGWKAALEIYVFATHCLLSLR